MARALLSLCLLSLLVGCQTFPPLPEIGGDPRTAALEDLFTKLHAEGAFNGNIIVAEGGAVLFAGSYGIADDATGRLLDRESVLELASVGKAFTAMAICILHDAGQLDLDDAVALHLPSFPYPEVTVRNLLQHTGGMPDGYRAVMKDRTTIATNADLLAALEGLPLAFAPGTQFEYSNTGYVTLAEVITAVSGQPFGEFLRARIFRPLGMRSTRAYSTRYTEGEVIENYAYGYLPKVVAGEETDDWELPSLDNQAAYAILLSGIEGDGNIVSTLDDMVRWDIALREHALLEEEIWRQMFAPARLENGTFQAYGFGWGIDMTADGETVYVHTGGWPGVQSMIQRFPRERRLVFYVKNRETLGWSWLQDLERILDSDVSREAASAPAASPHLR